LLPLRLCDSETLRLPSVHLAPDAHLRGVAGGVDGEGGEGAVFGGGGAEDLGGPDVGLFEVAGGVVSRGEVMPLLATLATCSHVPALRRRSLGFSPPRSRMIGRNPFSSKRLALRRFSRGGVLWNGALVTPPRRFHPAAGEPESTSSRADCAGRNSSATKSSASIRRFARQVSRKLMHAFPDESDRDERRARTASETLDTTEVGRLARHTRACPSLLDIHDRITARWHAPNGGSWCRRSWVLSAP
jgi:hypothetical protein